MPAVTPTVTPTTGRWRALDLFRGATVAAMIGVNNPGSWQHLYPPLAHAGWHGWTPTDLVFPFFLFAVGVSLAVVGPGLLAMGWPAFWRKWLWRGLGLLAIGLLLNALSLPRWEGGALVLRPWSDWRLPGVLQRIALCWMAAALIVRLARGRTGVVMAVAAALLVGYVPLALHFGAAGDPWSLEGFFGTALDRRLLGPGHLYRGEGVPFDPEGLASTLPALAQVLIGWWVGQRATALGLGGAGAAAPPAAWPPGLLRALAIAAALVVAGLALDAVVPINKKLWTPSYVALSSGLALLGLLAVQRLARPASSFAPRIGPAGPLAALGGPGPRQPLAFAASMLEAYGRHALAIFVLSGIVPRLQALIRVGEGLDPATGLPRRIAPFGWLYEQVFRPLAADPRLGSLLMALAQVLAYGLLAQLMVRRGWSVRL